MNLTIITRDFAIWKTLKTAISSRIKTNKKNLKLQMKMKIKVIGYFFLYCHLPFLTSHVMYCINVSVKTSSLMIFWTLLIIFWEGFSEPSLIALNFNVLKKMAWSYIYCFISSFIHSSVPANASQLLTPHHNNKRHGTRKLEQHSTESTSYPRSPSGQNSNGYYTVTTSHIYVSLWITVDHNSKLHCHIGILFPSNFGLVLHICFSSHLLLYSSYVHHN